MKSLLNLYIYKQIGKVRNMFRKTSSAVTSVLIILLYGSMIINSIRQNGDMQQASDLYGFNLDVSKLILLELGFLMIILLSMLLRKKNSLFFEEDAYYLFSGPFSDRQVMSYLTFNNIVNAAMFSLIAEFIFYSYSFMVKVPPALGWLVLFVNFAVSLFFIILTDTLYLYSISDNRHKVLSKIVVAVLLGVVVVVFGIALVQNDFDITAAFNAFVVSRLFYLVPVIGFAKMILSSFVLQEYFLMLVGIVMLLGSLVLVHLALINFKGEYKEQVLNDSREMSQMVRQVRKSGVNKPIKEVKDSNVSVKFRTRAFAVFSKNLLLMKKTRSFVEGRYLLVMGIYIVITLFSDLGFMFYMFMNSMLLFTIVSTGDLVTELKNHQLYLIPDTSFNKIKAVVALPFMQTLAYNFASMTVMALLLRVPLIQYLAALLFTSGMACVFISGSVLSVRLLKESTNAMFESVIRMLLMFLGLLPAVAAAAFIFVLVNDFEIAFMVAGLVTLLINALVAFIVLYISRTMMQRAE